MRLEAGRHGGQPALLRAAAARGRAYGLPGSLLAHLEFHLGRCEDYWQRQPDAAPGAARPNLTQADPVPASQASGRGADRGDDADGPTRDPRVPLDGGTIEEAS